MDFVPYVGTLVSLFLAGANVMIFCVVKFNDLKHQEESLKRIETTLGKMDEKTDNIAQRVSNIEGKCKANHG